MEDCRILPALPALHGVLCRERGWCLSLQMQVLVELELPHIYHTVARNSPKRPLMTEKWGNFQVCPLGAAFGNFIHSCGHCKAQ